jgi:hypothetical protein
MSDQPKDPTPKKRVVRSRVAAQDAAPKPAMTQVVGAAPQPAAASTAPRAGVAPQPTAAETISRANAASQMSAETAPRANTAPPTAADAAANAALALAVMGARKETAAPAAKVAPVPPPGRMAALMRRPAIQAAALVVAVAAGGFGAFAATRASVGSSPAQWTETTQALRQGQQDVVRLTGDIKALKVAIESLKESVDRSKTDLMAKQAQVMERVERTPADSGRLTKLAEQLDRLEAAGKEPVARFAALTERFDRLERQITTLQTAAAKPAAPAPVVDGPSQTGTLEAKPAAKEPPKDVQLDGWTLHEVYDGVALIEGRNRRLYEVGQGGVIPGVGPVEAIERRGKRWVVVTQKGFIGNER